MTSQTQCLPRLDVCRGERKLRLSPSRDMAMRAETAAVLARLAPLQGGVGVIAQAAVGAGAGGVQRGTPLTSARCGTGRGGVALPRYTTQAVLMQTVWLGNRNL